MHEPQQQTTVGERVKVALVIVVLILLVGLFFSYIGGEMPMMIPPR